MGGILWAKRKKSFDLLSVENKCPINSVLEAIGGKWNYKIILCLSNGCMRFNELLKCLDGISAKTLTCCLKKLEKKNIIKKTIYPVVPIHVEYKCKRQISPTY
ncbi:winged helix-turn-helix transcriptional regulator [Niallia sp. 01092]|uniref:winged helix-turn-helix transcriptional regulator n=1 Tax=unclassified Niallia TaxID=2837522 RepID=UPI003FD1FE15